MKKDFLKEMIKVAQPVIKWLEEAEEDSEEEDEGDMAVAFDDRSRAVGTVVEKEQQQPAKKVQAEAGKKGGSEQNTKEAEEDFDIDNI